MIPVFFFVITHPTSVLIIMLKNIDSYTVKHYYRHKTIAHIINMRNDNIA